MIQCIENDSEVPICPHCESQITQVFSRKLDGVFGVRFIYFCAKCRKVLGVSHRKGFWMG